MIRLDKYLAERLGLTRSESRRKIAAGAVAVDGAVCKRPDASSTKTPRRSRWKANRWAAPMKNTST